MNQDSFLLIGYLQKGQTVSAEYYSSLLVQLKAQWRKNDGRGKVTKGVFFLHEDAPAHRALAGQKKLTYLCTFLITHPILRIWPRRTTKCSLDYKSNWMFAICFWRGCHCCHGDLVGRTTFWIFLSSLLNLKQRAKKCTELRWEDFQ